jgi:citrate lyase subunit beta/citryl-CoA lyase
MINMQLNYLMRSLLFVPAHNERFLNSAMRSEADVLLLDIEDSCLPNENKQIARNNIIKYVQEGKFKDKILFPRVNERVSGELLKDVYQLTIPGIHGFMYPKARTADDIYFFGTLLEAIEYEKHLPIGSFKIIPLIETTGAVLCVQEICTICKERVVAIAFGHLDYVLDLRENQDFNGSLDSLETARALIPMGARTAKIIPIDTIHPHDVRNMEELEQQLISGKKLGYEGMLLLHPMEIPLVHKYYSPSQDEITWAHEIITLHKDAVNEGKGVAIKNGRFIGPPIVKSAEKIVNLAEKIIEKSKLMGINTGMLPI